MSLVTLECLAVLENPRVGVSDKPKSVTLDAQIYLDGSQTSLIGCLTWYNEHNFDFPEELSAYRLWVQLVYLGPTSELDLRYRAIAHICGTVSHTNAKDGTFQVDAEQYITALRAAAAMPFKVIIPDSPRYRTKKPVPTQGGRVLVTGHIMDVERLLDNKDSTPGSVVHFIVEMNTVVFLGASAKGDGGTPAAQKSVKTEGAPTQLKFNFNTPSPAQRGTKRNLKDREDGGVVEDKGEGSSKRTR
ncbi:hypothetical protein DFH09DRAFT_1093315 [Mycena vulgaris]|nr:hypothetical protein DFH09DRAFT_1093315 [Mycena vulgaris]